MSNVEIIKYKPQYAADFERLNVAWLEKYFYVEPYDAEVLANPEKHILNDGGEIYLAECEGEIIGTLALMYRGSELEVTKMSVDERFQGQGIGKRLMEFTLQRAQEMKPKKIFLLTSSSLEAANGLYEKSGFVSVPLHEGDNTTYARCDRRWELPVS